MNFFLKNRFVFWLLIFLVVINLTALMTFLVFYTRNSASLDQQPRKTAGMGFRKELALSPAQCEKVEGLLADYRKETEQARENIRNKRTQLLEELEKDKPDTTILNRCADEICVLQKQMQNASVKQYLALKGICNPAQCQRLSALYFELYGFQSKGKGIGQGKGMMHQYRRGQGQQGRGNMMMKDS